MDGLPRGRPEAQGALPAQRSAWNTRVRVQGTRATRSRQAHQGRGSLDARGPAVKADLLRRVERDLRARRVHRPSSGHDHHQATMAVVAEGAVMTMPWTM